MWLDEWVILFNFLKLCTWKFVNKIYIFKNTIFITIIVICFVPSVERISSKLMEWILETSNWISSIPLSLDGGEWIFLIFSLTFLFIFFVCLLRFNWNTNIYVNTYLQQKTTYITQRFHLLIFSCLLNKMVLPLIMKTEKNFKLEKMLKFTQFCNF